MSSATPSKGNCPDNSSRSAACTSGLFERVGLSFNERGFLRTVLLILIYGTDQALAYIKRNLSRIFSNKLNRGCFGVLESIIHGHQMSIWERYAAITAEMQEAIKEAVDDITVIDIGAGGNGLAEWIGMLKGCLKISVGVLDLSATRLQSADKAQWRIVADGAALPFRDCSVDGIVCADTLEHVDPATRRKLASEMIRVSKRFCIVHVPVLDESGTYQGKKLDLLYQQWHIRRMKRPCLLTDEHLRTDEYPTITELSVLFPGSKIRGSQNAKKWIENMKLDTLPVVRHITMPFKRSLWPRINEESPFHSCVISWTRNDKAYY